MPRDALMNKRPVNAIISAPSQPFNTRRLTMADVMVQRNTEGQRDAKGKHSHHYNYQRAIDTSRGGRKGRSRRANGIWRQRSRVREVKGRGERLREGRERAPEGSLKMGIG